MSYRPSAAAKAAPLAALFFLSIVQAGPLPGGFAETLLRAKQPSLFPVNPVASTASPQHFAEPGSAEALARAKWPASFPVNAVAQPVTRSDSPEAGTAAAIWHAKMPWIFPGNRRQ